MQITEGILALGAPLDVNVRYIFHHHYRLSQFILYPFEHIFLLFEILADIFPFRRTGIEEIPVFEIYTAFIVCLVDLQPWFFRNKKIPQRGIFLTDGLESLVTVRPSGFRVEFQHVAVQFKSAPRATA